MRDINLNEFKKRGINFEIGDKIIRVNFIPYPIEKEIYTQIGALQEELANIGAISSDRIDQVKYWITEIFTHQKNKNEIDANFIDDELGVTEMMSIILSIINFISDRLLNTYEQLNLTSGGQEGKT